VLILFTRNPDPRAIHGTVEVNPSETRTCTGKAGVNLECLLEEGLRLCLRFGREFIQETVPLEEQVIGAGVLWLPPSGGELALSDHAIGDCSDDAMGDLLLIIRAVGSRSSDG
jgi:hypothetical protein